MIAHEIEHNGRLVIFRLTHCGQEAVTATGYALKEGGLVRLYLVSLLEPVRKPPHRLTHVAVTRFARALNAQFVVPVDHGMPGVLGRVTSSAIEDGFIPCLPTVSLDELAEKLESASA